MASAPAKSGEVTTTKTTRSRRNSSKRPTTRRRRADSKVGDRGRLSDNAFSERRAATDADVSVAQTGSGTEQQSVAVAATPRPRVSMPAYQAAAIQRDDRLTWNNWSRQTGKSFAFTLRRLLRGLIRGRTQLFLSAGERQARELMEHLRSHCHVLRIACSVRRRDSLDGSAYKRLEATLPSGVRVIALPANPYTARGYSADVFLDEFAMHHDDRAIWAALFPTLLRGDGELDVASTPRGRGNMFHGLSGNPQFAHSTVTLPEAVAQGLDVDAARMRAAMNDERLYRQEFLCEFDADDSALLSYDTISACGDPEALTTMDRAILADRVSDVYLGADVGRRRDLTVIWAWRREGDMYRTVGVIELAQTPFARQREILSSLIEQPSVRRACIDATGIGMALAEELSSRYGTDRVEGVTFTSAVQSAMAMRLRVLAEERRVSIPVDETIYSDWHSLRRHVNVSGHVRLRAAHTEQGHADRFWAAALGLHAASEGDGAGVDYAFGDPLDFAGAGVW